MKKKIKKKKKGNKTYQSSLPCLTMGLENKYRTK